MSMRGNIYKTCMCHCCCHQGSAELAVWSSQELASIIRHDKPQAQVEVVHQFQYPWEELNFYVYVCLVFSISGRQQWLAKTQGFDLRTKRIVSHFKLQTECQWATLVSTPVSSGGGALASLLFPYFESFSSCYLGFWIACVHCSSIRRNRMLPLSHYGETPPFCACGWTYWVSENIVLSADSAVGVYGKSPLKRSWNLAVILGQLNWPSYLRFPIVLFT